MALFKIFKGPEENLLGDGRTKPRKKCVEGYAYFCEDTGNMFIDVATDEDGTNRVQINAYKAKVLGKAADGSDEIDIDDILLKEILAKGSIVVGVEDSYGSIVAGELKGTGALYSSTSGQPTFGTLPVAQGGTGATTKIAARTSLEVYSTSQVDDKVKTVTTVAYTFDLPTGGWVEDGDLVRYDYENDNLTCGVGGNVPPIITYTENLDDYMNLDHADAIPGWGIKFYASKAPENIVKLIIVDNK